MLLRHKEDVQERPERTANVREQEIESVQRYGMKSAAALPLFCVCHALNLHIRLMRAMPPTHKRRAERAARVHMMGWQVEPAEMIDRKRHQDIRRDSKVDKCARADLVDEQQPRDDRERPNCAAEWSPPTHG